MGIEAEVVMVRAMYVVLAMAGVLQAATETAAAEM